MNISVNYDIGGKALLGYIFMYMRSRCKVSMVSFQTFLLLLLHYDSLPTCSMAFVLHGAVGDDAWRVIGPTATSLREVIGKARRTKP